MTRGLLWLPLLAVFFWLAWAGWNEFQKLEAYRRWAESFDHAKYDIYAVLGQKGAELTWGKPTRRGPENLQTFSLQQVQSIHLRLDDQPVALDQPPSKAQKVALEFQLDAAPSIQIPFTDLAIAIQWGHHLQQDWQQLGSSKS
jgi:hypothetical protein